MPAARPGGMTELQEEGRSRRPSYGAGSEPSPAGRFFLARLCPLTPPAVAGSGEETDKTNPERIMTRNNLLAAVVLALVVMGTVEARGGHGGHHGKSHGGHKGKSHKANHK